MKSNSIFARLDFFEVVLFILSVISFSIIAFFNLIHSFPLQAHFVWLAEAFAHGSLAFLFTVPPYNFLNDYVIFGDKLFWALGPLPAILFVPFVVLSNFLKFHFVTGYMQFMLVIATWIQIYRLAKKALYTNSDSAYLASAFCFGSVFILTAVFAKSYEFSHVLCVLLLVTVLNEYLGRKRWYLIGTLVGMLMLTRLTASVIIVFFIIEIFRNFYDRKSEMVAAITRLCIPVIISALLIGSYNFARFGDVFEQGYSLQYLFYKPLSQARSYGVMSTIHLAGNVYYALISTPQPVFLDNVSHVLAAPYVRPDGWGLSLFFTSPFLLALFFLNYRRKIFISLWTSVIFIATPLFFYYGIGNYQIGYRYGLDFLPIIFLIFMLAYKDVHNSISNRMKVAIIGSILINIYLLYSVGLLI